MLKKIILFVFILSINVNAQNEHIEFEKKVFNDLFLAIVDSVHFDFRLAIPPPPNLPPKGSAIYDSLKERNEIYYKKVLQEFYKRKAEIEKDTTKLIIVMYDSISKMGEEDLKNLPFKLQKNKYDNYEYLVNFSKINNNKKYRFLPSSNFPKGSKIWRKKYPFKISGFISLSRIKFDTTKQNGVLVGDISYSKLNGRGFRIFIKREKNKWIIDKIEGTWIS